MKYRYKKGQIFRKSLSVPPEVYKRIYNKNATIYDFINYDLFSKIPLECMTYVQRRFVNQLGIEKARFFDWDCALALNEPPFVEWLKKNNQQDQSIDILNFLMYTEIKNEYYAVLESGFSVLDYQNLIYNELLMNYENGSSHTYFERLGERFSKAMPELTYTSNIKVARLLLFNELSLSDYILNYKEFKTIPHEFIMQSFQDDVEKKIFNFVGPYMVNGEFFEENQFLLNIAFSYSKKPYDYKNYLNILEENPEIDIVEFLKKACIKRTSEQKWLLPKSAELSKYNSGKEILFTFDDRVNLGIRSYSEILPQYARIFFSFSNGFETEKKLEEFDKPEDFIYYLIHRYDLSYVHEAPDEFKNAYPNLFLDEKHPLCFEFNYKQLTPQLIQENSKYLESLKDKEIALGFRDLTMREFIYKIGNTKFFELCLKYGKLLRPVDFSDTNKSIEELIEDQLGSEMHTHIVSYEELEKFPNIVKQNPDYFLDETFPDDLKTAFYQSEITPKFLQEHPEYSKILMNKNIAAGLVPIFKQLCVKLSNSIFIEICNNYGIYLSNKNFKLNVDLSASNEEIISGILDSIFVMLIHYSVSYDENLPKAFQEKYPELFLPSVIEQEIKYRFYQRSLLPSDFSKEPRLIQYFNHLDVAVYLDSSDYSWLTKINIDNISKIKLAFYYQNMNSYQLQQIFSNFILKNVNDIDFKKITFLADLLKKISYSNSSEIIAIQEPLALQLLKLENPLEMLSKIEEVFLKNNLPMIGKIFIVFQMLHPNFRGFDFSTYSHVSPILKTKMNKEREVIIFADLIKASFGSNNRSILSYLKNIEQGYNLLKDISSNKISIDSLNLESKRILTVFIEHLNTLYNHSQRGKFDSNILSKNLEDNIKKMIQLFSEDGNLEYNLPDRVLKMFCHSAGFDTFEQAMNYFTLKPKLADLRNRKASNEPFMLKKGDFVKGINSIDFLENILQNGSLAQEYLGADANSDSTPLDTDLVCILQEKDTLRKTLEEEVYREYGPIYLVLKNNDRFAITRKSLETLSSETHLSYDSNKIEAFCTGVMGEKHYGIRTGFASSEIDSIITEKEDCRIGFEIAKNGFYIPIVDSTGNLIFTPQDYDNFRSKMLGLKYYNMTQYNFSDYLMFPGIEEYVSMEPQNIEENSRKEKYIYRAVKEAFQSLNLSIKTEIDGVLTEGIVEIINTGSTGRGTNVPGDADFDYIIRLDRSLILDFTKMNEIKKVLLRNFESYSGIVNDNIFRLTDVSISGLEEKVSIDITFIPKTDKISYSSDMSLLDRLETIKAQSLEQYTLVVANIILAKKILKEAKAYKSRRKFEGGLGGIGIENWILQNGGSFIEAAQNFLEVAEGKSFLEFEKNYEVWDFGKNHLSENEGKYPYDEYVKKNMSETGYQNMKVALQNYLNQLQNDSNKSVSR